MNWYPSRLCLVDINAPKPFWKYFQSFEFQFTFLLQNSYILKNYLSEELNNTALFLGKILSLSILLRHQFHSWTLLYLLTPLILQHTWQRMFYYKNYCFSQWYKALLVCEMKPYFLLFFSWGHQYLLSHDHKDLHNKFYRFFQKIFISSRSKDLIILDLHS
jgi:hypothetical protein